MLVTRIAPTPSGFLHEGNAVNMLLTSWWARSAGGRLLLRIDDFDVTRARAAYVADILDTADWLGIRIDDGPTGVADFTARWSTARHTERLRAAVQRLLAGSPEVVFVCRCSRRELGEWGQCTAGCRRGGFPLRAGGSTVRLHVPQGLVVTVGGGELPVPRGDHVLWRRDDLPAYQLGSVLLDEALGVTAVLRGVDLVDSTALQRHLAALLPAPGFLSADVRHHGLLTGPAGVKLSKSAGARAEPLARTAALRGHLESVAARLGGPLGISPPVSWSGPRGS